MHVHFGGLFMCADRGLGSAGNDHLGELDHVRVMRLTV